MTRFTVAGWAEALVESLEVATGLAFAIQSEPRPLSDDPMDREARRHRRTWKAESGDWVVMVRTGGFCVHAFLVHFSSGDKGARMPGSDAGAAPGR